MIVALKHLDLVCVAADRERTLERLRDLGAVHLDLLQAQGTAIADLRGEIADAERAVRLVLKARGKAPRDSFDLRPRSVAEVLAVEQDRLTLVAEQEYLDRQVKEYEPYGDFDPELARRLLEKGVDLSDRLPAKLPEMRLSRLREKLSCVTNRINIDQAKLAATDEEAILRRNPDLAERLAFEQAKELMQQKGAVAVISGWVPVTRLADLQARIAAEGWGALLRDPAADETPPTLINPPRAFRSVRALFAGLGIAPAYDEADVSVPFMCYFSLFFAMLVGDGAYGVIFLAATLFCWRKLVKPGQAMTPKLAATRSWLVLMTVFSLATIAWGVLSNTWFGEGLPWCANWPTVRWLAGADAGAGHEYDNMMFLCFTIGVSHLLLARIWNGICKINSRAALSEFGWAGIVLFMYVLTNSIVGIFGGVPTWCYWMFGLSFLSVFIQAKGMDKGMLFLNTMSVLGDIISYVRLFAVGLASVKVAQNFNSMAVGLGLPIWLKWLPLVLILLIGHGLNLAMAGLSVLVHAVRLNTLEFSNHKGISWAGFAFKPFMKTKE